MRWPSPIWLAVASAATLWLTGSCHLVGGTDGLFIEEPGGSSSGTGGTTTSSTSSSTTGEGGGGGSESCDPVDPPEPDTDCAFFECIEGGWQKLTQPTETPCDDDGGFYCDGAGTCVECIDNDHCTGESPCQDYECKPLGCANGTVDSGESDVDCGGPCGGCANGQMCNSNGDCLSWFCGGNYHCAPCSTHTDCPDNTWYCAQGDHNCHVKKDNYSACNFGYECQTGNCCWWGSYQCTPTSIALDCK